MFIAPDLSGYPPGKAYALAVFDGMFRAARLLRLLGHGMCGTAILAFCLEDLDGMPRWGTGLLHRLCVLSGAVALAAEGGMLWLTVERPHHYAILLPAPRDEVASLLHVMMFLGSMPFLVVGFLVATALVVACSAGRFVWWWIACRAGRPSGPWNDDEPRLQGRPT